MNPLIVLGPIGMLLVGVLAIEYWRRRSHAGMRLFALGGLVWAAAIIPKVVLDLTVTPSLYGWFAGSLGFNASLVALGAYVGLRTGVFECGFTYLAFRRSKLREATVDEATAFGIGFGATEAILLALPSLISLVTFLSNPSLLDGLPPDVRQAVEAQLYVSPWVLPAPALERLFTIFIHVFSALLIYASVTKGQLGLFIGAFAYKSLVDAAAPYLQSVLGSSASPVDVYLVETWVVALGIIGLIGSVQLRKHMPSATQPSSNTEPRTADNG